MGLPEEDKGPAWLRDYGRNSGQTQADTATGYVDSDALKVELDNLLIFASTLESEHQKDYVPHATKVLTKMSVQAAPVDPGFIELFQSMSHHSDMLNLGLTAMYEHDKAVTRFIEFARMVSEEFGATDALSETRVSQVDQFLTSPPPGSQIPVGVDETSTEVK